MKGEAGTSWGQRLRPPAALHWSLAPWGFHFVPYWFHTPFTHDSPEPSLSAQQSSTYRGCRHSQHTHMRDYPNSTPFVHSVRAHLSGTPSALRLSLLSVQGPSNPFKTLSLVLVFYPSLPGIPLPYEKRSGINSTGKLLTSTTGRDNVLTCKYLHPTDNIWLKVVPLKFCPESLLSMDLVSPDRPHLLFQAVMNCPKISTGRRNTLLFLAFAFFFRHLNGKNKPISCFYLKEKRKMHSCQDNDSQIPAHVTGPDMSQAGRWGWASPCWLHCIANQNKATVEDSRLPIMDQLHISSWIKVL